MIFHIGAAKTGTSALQAFLSRNREILPFAYPAGRGDLRARAGEITTGNAFDLAVQVESQPQEAYATLKQDALYSGERFWTVPMTTLSEWLKPLDATVLFYARPQLRLLSASYLQRVHHNGFKGSPEEWVSAAAEMEFHARRVELFSPNCRLIVRKYDRRTLVNCDIVDDFFEALAYRVPPQAVRFPRINLTPAEQPLSRDLALRIVELFWNDNEKLDSTLPTPFDFNADNLAEFESLFGR